MATFLVNEINTTEEAQQVQQRMSKLFFPLKDKKCRQFADIFFFWDVDE